MTVLQDSKECVSLFEISFAKYDYENKGQADTDPIPPVSGSYK